eukprot:6207900-Amphidinium_carterae.1
MAPLSTPSLPARARSSAPRNEFNSSSGSHTDQTNNTIHREREKKKNKVIEAVFFGISEPVAVAVDVAVVVVVVVVVNGSSSPG